MALAESRRPALSRSPSPRTFAQSVTRSIFAPRAAPRHGRRPWSALRPQPKRATVTHGWAGTSRGTVV
eukprot:6600780-Pyramimonas_sp.AAC.1